MQSIVKIYIKFDSGVNTFVCFNFILLFGTFYLCYVIGIDVNSRHAMLGHRGEDMLTEYVFFFLPTNLYGSYVLASTTLYPENNSIHFNRYNIMLLQMFLGR